MKRYKVKKLGSDFKFIEEPIVRGSRKKLFDIDSLLGIAMFKY